MLMCEDLVCLDCKWKKKGLNDEWMNLNDLDVQIIKMKDGCMYLVYK